MQFSVTVKAEYFQAAAPAGAARAAPTGQAMKRRPMQPRYEAAVYQDDPDAIATVNVFDPERDAVIPVEIGYYYHGKSGSTIYLLSDVRSKSRRLTKPQILVHAVSVERCALYGDLNDATAF